MSGLRIEARKAGSDEAALRLASKVLNSMVLRPFQHAPAARSRNYVKRRHASCFAELTTCRTYQNFDVICVKTLLTHRLVRGVEYTT